MSNARILYTPHPETKPEVELDALAAVYRFVLDCKAKKEATGLGGRNDVRKDQDAHTAKSIIPERR
jgi:hypothetical protein